MKLFKSNPQEQSSWVHLAGIFAAVALLLRLTSTLVEAAAAPPTKNEALAAPSAPAVFVVPKSEFLDDFKLGKDPFFPNSRRRFPVIADPITPSPTNGPNRGPVVLSNPKAFLNSLNLKGVLRTPKGRRLAVVENYTFAPGETHVIKMGSTSHTVRCEEIGNKEVVVSIVGTEEKRTIHLPQN